MSCGHTGCLMLPFTCLVVVKHREDDWVARCQFRVIKALVLTVNCASYLTNSQEITYKI